MFQSNILCSVISNAWIKFFCYTLANVTQCSSFPLLLCLNHKPLLEQCLGHSLQRGILSVEQVDFVVKVAEDGGNGALFLHFRKGNYFFVDIIPIDSWNSTFIIKFFPFKCFKKEVYKFFVIIMEVFDI